MSSAIIFKNDPYLIVPKALFFLVNAVFYSVHGLIGIHLYKENELTPLEFGLVTSVYVVNLFASVFWTNMADRTGHYKSILILTIMAYACFFSLQVFKPKDFMPYFGLETNKVINVGFVILVTAVANFFGSAIFPLLDNVALSLLAQNPGFTKEMYGRQRLFGSIGHTLITIAAVEMKRLYSKSGMFIVMIVCAILSSLLVAFGVPAGLTVPEHLKGHGHHGGGHGSGDKKKEQQPQRTDTPASDVSGVSINKNQMLIEKAMPYSATPNPPAIEAPAVSPAMKLFTNPAYVLFIIFVFFAGYLRTIIGNFAPLLLHEYKKEKDDNFRVLIGQQFFKLASELMIFFFGKQLMSIFGVHWMLLISQVAGLARVFGYGFMPADEDAFWMTYIWEFLKGLNTGLFFTSAVRISNDIAPKGFENTAQGIFSGVYSGFATSVAGLISGFIVMQYPPNKYGLAQMFRLSGYAATFVTLLFFIKFAFVDRTIMTCIHGSAPKKGSANLH